MESRLRFGKIHIIEWLAPGNRRTGDPGDRRTGTEIYRAAKQLIAETGSRIDIILHRVSSRASFLARLERIEQDFRATGKLPLLEIETQCSRWTRPADRFGTPRCETLTRKG